MNENENNFLIRFNDGEQLATRDTTELNKFIGYLAVFNHVFIELSNDGEVRKGVFLPEQAIGAETFKRIENLMVQREYPLHLNQREVPEGDMQAITRLLAGDVGDTIPDGWL